MNIILASTSPYRRQLLSRLRLAFTCTDPAVDESPLTDELAADRACRLARQKAEAVSGAAGQSADIVIGADQVACLGDQILHKPGSIGGAIAQQSACSGKKIQFWTAVSVQCHATRAHFQQLVSCEVTLRTLTSEEIERYVALDKPLDCAGSFKWESLGITLFESMQTADPTALEGLPLIALCDLLRQVGVSLPLAAQASQH